MNFRSFPPALAFERAVASSVGNAPALLNASFSFRLKTVTQSPALVVEGSVRNQDGVVNVKTDRISPLRDPELPLQANHYFHELAAEHLSLQRKFASEERS